MAYSSAPFSQLLLMMSWQLMAWRMKIRGHLLVVSCRVELCCGVLDYVVLCGRMKIRGHFYTRAADLSAKRGWGVFAVWWRVFLLTWWCSKYSTQHPFSLLNLLFAEKYKQGFRSNAWRLLALAAIMTYIWCGLLCTDLSTRNWDRGHQTNAKVAAKN